MISSVSPKKEMPETGRYADNSQDNTEWATGIYATFKPRYFGM
jgi:hypothetical protein